MKTIDKLKEISERDYRRLMYGCWMHDEKKTAREEKRLRGLEISLISVDEFSQSELLTNQMRELIRSGELQQDWVWCDHDAAF